MAETLKLEIPENIVKAAELFAPVVGMETEEFLLSAISSDIEGWLGSFGPDMGMDPVPLYLNPCRYAWITWWYGVLEARAGYDDIGDFLWLGVMKVVEPYVETLTDLEKEGLDRLKRELGIPDESPLKTEIRQLLNTPT